MPRIIVQKEKESREDVHIPRCLPEGTSDFTYLPGYNFVLKRRLGSSDTGNNVIDFGLFTDLYLDGDDGKNTANFFIRLRVVLELVARHELTGVNIMTNKYMYGVVLQIIELVYIFNISITLPKIPKEWDDHESILYRMANEIVK